MRQVSPNQMFIQVFVTNSVCLIGVLALCSSQNVDDNEQFCAAPHSPCIMKNHVQGIINHFSSNTNIIDNQREDQNCFRAAIYESARHDLVTCQQSYKMNLDIFDRVAETASRHGAQMIVFPEDGILMGELSFVVPCLENIPHAGIRELVPFDDQVMEVRVSHDPCLDRDKFVHAPILTRLSCIARKHKMYVIANYGTREDCSKSFDETCPSRGFFAFNTDVVFDPDGTFIARYRKYNIFIEIFDRAKKVEHVYFDTPYGRFGVFTCFDMIYKSPAVDLVEHSGIDTAIFPTWWYDEMPILTAIQYQDAWSSALKINLLAANILAPELGSVGSSISSGNDSVYVGPANQLGSRLVISNLVRHPRKHPLQSPSSLCREGFNQTVVDMITMDAKPTSKYIYKKYRLVKGDSILVLNDQFNKQMICSGRVCCTIDYKLQEFVVGATALPMLIVRDSSRGGTFGWYEQVCSVATVIVNDETIKRLKLSSEIQGVELDYSLEGLYSFEYLKLEAVFETDYVYPYAAHNVSSLLKRNLRQFSCMKTEGTDKVTKLNSCKLEVGQHTINTIGMYARVYERDPKETRVAQESSIAQ